MRSQALEPASPRRAVSLAAENPQITL